jgi:pSer/pThr/pTyr-binding forkhead associated (FHA) protein
MSSRKSIEVSVLTGPDKGKRHSVRGEYARIGRDSSCEIPLADPIISRIHGTLEVTARCGAYVFNDHSRNGTYFVKAGHTQPDATGG